MHNLAHRWNFELPEIPPLLRNNHAARIGIRLIHANSDIGELLCRQIRPAAALHALTFAVIEIEPRPLLLA